MTDDRAVLACLVENARQSVEDIARQTDLDEAEVERAIEELEAAGALRGYQAVVDWSRVEGEDDHAEAAVELNVELDRETGYEEIADRITRFSEVTTLRLVSGDFDFLLVVEGDSMHTISQFVSEQIAPIPEVTQTVTHFVMETYKARGVEFRDDGDDDRLSVSP